MDSGQQGLQVKDVHTEHCCRFHGCKYNSKDCTVVHKGALQAYPCEDCDAEQGRAIQEERFPRCGLLPKNPDDNMPCFLRKDHPVGIHRNLNGMFTMTRRYPSDPPPPSDPIGTDVGPDPEPIQASHPVLSQEAPLPLTPQQRAAERAKQRAAMELLRDAVERVHGIGMSSAWDALYMIEAILVRQEKAMKNIQSEYLALISRRISHITNQETRVALLRMREELDKT